MQSWTECDAFELNISIAQFAIHLIILNARILIQNLINCFLFLFFQWTTASYCENSWIELDLAPKRSEHTQLAHRAQILCGIVQCFELIGIKTKVQGHRLQIYHQRYDLRFISTRNFMNVLPFRMLNSMLICLLLNDWENGFLELSYNLATILLKKYQKVLTVF